MNRAEKVNGELEFESAPLSLDRGNKDLDGSIAGNADFFFRDGLAASDSGFTGSFDLPFGERAGVRLEWCPAAPPGAQRPNIEPMSESASPNPTPIPMPDVTDRPKLLPEKCDNIPPWGAAANELAESCGYPATCGEVELGPVGRVVVGAPGAC